MLIGAIAGGLALSLVTVFLLAYGWIGTWVVRSRALPRLAGLLGRPISVAAIDVGLGTLVLEDLVVQGASEAHEPLVRVPRITAEFSFWQSLLARVDVQRVEVEQPQVFVERYAGGGDNLRDVLSHLRARRKGTSDGAGGGRRALPVLVVRRAALTFRDMGAGIAVDGQGVSAQLAGGKVTADIGEIVLASDFGPKAVLRQARFSSSISDPMNTAELVLAQGGVFLWPGMSLTGIKGKVARVPGAGRFALDFEGGYGGAQGTLWYARGWLEPASETGHLELRADRFTFDRIASVLRGTAVIDHHQTSVDAAITVDLAGDRARFDGSLSLSNLNVFHPMLAEKPVRNISFKGAVVGHLDRRARSLSLERGTLDLRGIPYEVSGVLELPGGFDTATGQRRALPRVAAHLVIPAVTCQAMFDSIPPEFVPYLNGFKLGGKFTTDLRLAIDWSNLDSTVLDGRVGLFDCKVERAPAELDAERLRESFEHYVEVEKDQWISFAIGPENPDFVPLWEVSPHLVNSLLTTEDSRFYEHRGFIPREFRTALVKDLKAGYFRYGGSSITMQMVKNVLLYREKTLARKFQELFLTWYVETVLTKDRIMEIYVNAIEYGPGLYGIGPAARHYFGKHPRDLTPVEAAFFSSILPSPKRRYLQYCRGELSEWSTKKLDRVLKLMLTRGRLTQEQYDAALLTPLVFDKTEALPERECQQLVKRALKNARPTNPMKR